MTSGRRWGKLVGRLGEARLKVADVLMLMEARQVAAMMMKVVKVTVKVLLEVKVMVKVFVLEVSLFSLSSTSFPRTRPAARVWA